MPIARTSQLPGRETGATLIESLVAILIFSFGLLGLVGLQAASIKNTADAKYRADAAFLANQIIGDMWADAPANLAGYAHRATDGACAPTGANSGNLNVGTWLTNINSTLPGGDLSSFQQIIVDAVTGQVTVTICWKPAAGASFNSFVTVAQILGS
jgi:type IV pilus assembly protein PilV